MTSQAADGPESVAASRRSKITPEREQEFFDAVLEQIRECGYDAVTMEGVATSTRCSKSTLYRQWKTKPQFVAAALRSRRSRGSPGSTPASLAEDLREAARAAGALVHADTKLLQALGHAVTQDEELARRAARGAGRTGDRRAAGDPAAGGRRGEVAADHPALEYIREVPFSYRANQGLKPGRGVVLKQGTDAVIVTYGMIMASEAYRAAQLLEEHDGISTAVIASPFLNRVDAVWLKTMLGDCRLLCTVDNHYVKGGFGDLLLSALTRARVRLPEHILCLGLANIPACGQPAEILAHHALDAESLRRHIRARLLPREH